VSAVFGSGFEVYLIGGYLRDLFRGVISRDIDFVFRGDPKAFIDRLTSRIGGRVVEFEKKGLTRLVLNRTTLDFTELKGGLIEDLSQRDFAMNSLAWSPQEGVIDPFKGCDDIRRGIVRAIARKNFIDDPLRLLRAYRFAGEFSWHIETKTRTFIKELHDNMQRPSHERITLEIFKLLNSAGYRRAIKWSHADGILTSFLVIDSGRLRRNIKAFSSFDTFLEKLPDRYRLKFQESFAQDLTYCGLLRAEILLYGADLKTSRLRLSNTIAKRIALTTDLLSLYEKHPKLLRRELYQLFAKADPSVMDFAFLTRKKRVIDEAGRFVNSRMVISSEEIMEMTGLRPGSELGAIIKEIRRLQFFRVISDRADAERWLKRQCPPGSEGVI
jgi:tRNA nucleotidyltransferase/poly(A) polymerase